MDTNGDKSSDTSNEELQRVEDLSETGVETPPVMQDKLVEKKSKTGLILGILLALALVACAVLGWLWYDQMTQNSELEAKVTTAENNVKAVSESLAAVEANIADQDEKLSESDAIVAVALAYARAPVNLADTEFSAEVKKRIDDFAGVDVTSDNGGFGMILKMVDDEWVVINATQDGPSEDEVKLYGIPEDIGKW